jgi:predicted alpha/beta-hydrolase family hydrolase
MDADLVKLTTSHGPARAHVTRATAPRGTLVLGHGAGGGVEAPDLLLACEVALDLGWSAITVEQPYVVAGKRAPAPIATSCAAWEEAIEELRRQRAIAPGLLVTGGRSMGARVACRTAAATASDAVLCLAFPLQPGPRKSGVMPPGRQDELNAVRVPVLVVQGVRDAFGMPRARSGASPRKVVRVAGDHGLKADPDAVQDAVRAWLADLGRA